MFTKTVRELEKTDLFPEKIFLCSSQSGIQIDREEDRSKIFYKFDQWGVEDNPN
jgi:hypothetical protein